MMNQESELYRIINLSLRDLEEEIANLEEEQSKVRETIKKLSRKDRRMFLKNTDTRDREVIEAEISVLEEYVKHLYSRKTLLTSVLNTRDKYQGFYFIADQH